MSSLMAFSVASFSSRASFPLEVVTSEVAVDELGLRKLNALHLAERALFELAGLRH